MSEINVICGKMKMLAAAASCCASFTAEVFFLKDLFIIIIVVVFFILESLQNFQNNIFLILTFNKINADMSKVQLLATAKNSP